MQPDDPTLRALRAAVLKTPEEAPLRRLLAERLLEQGALEDAEAEFREVLRRTPDDDDVKLGLARTFHRRGKQSAALVVVEELIRGGGATAAARLLHARILLDIGDVQGAVEEYRRAAALDPAVLDPELTERLGIGERDGPSMLVEGKLRELPGEDNSASPPAVERPAITFADVGGMESVKDEIRLKIIHPIAHPELYRAYGKPVGGAILLYGPPGCGKTHLARATAGEVRASFLAVGIDDVLDMWIGQSERRLHELFEQARASAPCVLFFDEVDALAASRSALRASGGRQLVNQFLSELDGVRASNEGVLILAATNAPWHLDAAFRRPGRFDRILFVPPPDTPARVEILRILCRGRPVERIDYDALAKRTEGFSGADLMAVVDRAIERKLAQALRAGEPRPLSTRDLADAAGTVSPSTRDWFATARNYAVYANEGGLYDPVVAYLKLDR